MSTRRLTQDLVEAMSGRFDFSSAELLNADQRTWLGSVLDNQTKKDDRHSKKQHRLCDVEVDDVK